MDLSTLKKEELKELAYGWMNSYRTGQGSFENVAQTLVNATLQEFRQADKRPAFALVRIFRATPYQNLHPDLKALATPDIPHYLALMGSAGQEKAWSSRHTAQKRKIIPISATMSPMFKGIFKELGFKWEDYSSEALPEGQSHDMSLLRYFYIPEARESTAITDQEQFVKAYGIRSVVAYGSTFLSGAAYTLIAFSTIPLTKSTVEIYAGLTSYVSTILALYENKLWN